MTAATVMPEAVRRKILSDNCPSAMFIDLEALRQRANAIRSAFPNALNTYAIKALPVPRVVRHVLSFGLGLEVASSGEIAIAEHLGVPSDRIVFDSPAKTISEIEDALKSGLRLNADTLEEIRRIAAVDGPKSRIGIRINPCLQGAAIPTTFTGSPSAKFGVLLRDSARDITNTIMNHDWIDGLHVHVGSQGCPIDLLVKGIGRVYDFAESINKVEARIRSIDIGGGLPATYRADNPAPTFEEYASALRVRAPGLFDGRYDLVTEFGRSLIASCGWVASRVEYVRSGESARTAVIHVGADMFVRPAYQPESWYHDISVFDSRGHRKLDRVATWSVAGPLCFSGDYVARNRRLPGIESGDILVVEDAGAYTLGMWSRYNSRPMPPVLTYDSDGSIEVARAAESVADVVAHWNGPIRNATVGGE